MALKNILLLITGVLLTFKVYAVPLLGETAGTIECGLVTLYKDHADPNKVYFFPNSTEFSKGNDDIPLFNFVYWGLDNVGAQDQGAYMTLTTHLASDATKAKNLKDCIKSNPNLKISVLPIKSSTIGLQKTTYDGSSPLSALFTEFNFAKAGGRPEDEIGVNAVLNAVGARAFRAMLLKGNGGSKLKIDYCYNVQGYGPSMDAKIRVNMKRVYEFFQASASVNNWFFSVGISRSVEKLHAEGAIHIEKNGGDAKDWEYLTKIAETVTTRLFKPELSASQSVGVASGNRPFIFTGGGVTKEEQKEETWTWVRRDLEEREFCTAVVLKDLEPYMSKLVISAD